MKQTSWLSGLAAVRNPSSSATRRTISFGHLPDRQPQPGQLGLAQHVQDVGLVFGRVAAPRRSCQLSRWPRPRNTGVVAGGDGVEAENDGPLQEAVELEVGVTGDARVRGRPSEWPATYGSTTSRSKSDVKLKTWWAIPSCWATRRASSTSATEQQPESDGPPQSFIVAPTTSWPSCSIRAAATDESTPAGHGDQDAH